MPPLLSPHAMIIFMFGCAPDQVLTVTVPEGAETVLQLMRQEKVTLLPTWLQEAAPTDWEMLPEVPNAITGFVPNAALIFV